jgi:hypothetical protein
MATYSKQLLSGSTNGKSIVIAATGTNTTTIHTTGTSNSVLDEVWLYATNSTAADIMVNILYGGTDFSTDVLFEGVIEAYSGNVLICPGLILRGNGTAGSVIYGNASVANGINIFGYVNRIS